MDEIYKELIEQLTRQGLNETINHFTQAKSAFDHSQWEAANSQVRAALESLFNAIAVIRLGSNKKGGEARKQLEDASILRKRESRLVQDFIDVAGGAGAHAGVSNKDESKGRLLAGFGVAYIGLALIPELTRVEDVVISKLNVPNGARLPTDAEMYTSCPTCGQEQTLQEAELSRKGEETIYTCKNGCQPIVIVGKPGTKPWEGRGYRLGDYVIRNAQDIFLPIIGKGTGIKIPASPAALMKRKPSGC